MELVTRQYERPGHQQRLLRTFTEDVFIFSLLVYIAHKSFLDDALYKFTYLLTYLLTYEVCEMAILSKVHAGIWDVVENVVYIQHFTVQAVGCPQ